MSPQVVMLFGRGVWLRGDHGWSCENFPSEGAISAAALERMRALVAGTPAGKWVIIFEPTGLDHQAVETPKANRRFFASLPEVQREHPVVASLGLGWGMEYPEPVAGAFMTLLHSETTPGLAQLCDCCSQTHSELLAVWCGYTAAAACLKVGARSANAWFVLLLLPGYVAAAACGGPRRLFKAWADPMSEREWAALAAIFGDFGKRPSTSTAKTELRRGGIVVVAEGEPGSLCPIWKEVIRSGRVESVVGLDGLASASLQIRGRHPANLLAGFPTPRRIDRYLAAVVAAGLLATLAFGRSFASERKRLQLESTEAAESERLLRDRLDQLNTNEAILRRLPAGSPGGEGTSPTARGGVLLGLAAAVPDELTLSSFQLRGDNRFTLEAILVGKDFNPPEVKEALERNGFRLNPGDGWAYDASTGRLSVRGRFERRVE